MMILKIIIYAVKYYYIKVNFIKDFSSLHDNIISKTFNIDVMRFVFEVICEKDILTMKITLMRMRIAVNIVIIFLNYNNLC